MKAGVFTQCLGSMIISRSLWSTLPLDMLSFVPNNCPGIITQWARNFAINSHTQCSCNDNTQTITFYELLMHYFEGNTKIIKNNLEASAILWSKTRVFCFEGMMRVRSWCQHACTRSSVGQSQLSSVLLILLSQSQWQCSRGAGHWEGVHCSGGYPGL